MLSVLAVTGPALSQPVYLMDEVERCKALEDDDPQQAETLAAELLAQAKVADDDVVAIEALGCMGWSQSRLGKQKESRASARLMGSEIASARLNPEQAMGLIRRAGSILHQAGDRVAAAEYYADALEIGIANNLKAEQIPLLINLAVLHSEFEDHERAIEHYEQALALMQELQDFRYQPPVLFNLALTLNGQGYYERALEYLQQTEAMIDANWPVARVVQVYSAMTSALVALERPQEALVYAQQAMSGAQGLGASGGLVSALVSQSEVFRALGRDAEALPLAEQATELAREINDSFLLRGALVLLSELYASQGRHEQALPLVQELREIDQSLGRSANTERLAEMEAILDDARQREELMELRYQAQVQKLELDREREYTRYGLIGGGIALALILGIVLWQRQMNRRLQHRSLTDTLTQLPNRRRLMEWLNQVPGGGSVRTLWLLDLDRFKSINDRFGHESGDALLCEIGHHLATLNTRMRIVGRWGGEEFLAVTDDVPEAEYDLFAEQLRGAISTARITVLDDRSVSVTTSIGRAQVPQDNYWEAALTQADAELYRDKKLD